MQYEDLLSRTAHGGAVRLSDGEIMKVVCERLADKYGQEAYNSWFKNFKFASKLDGQITVLVPTKFMREWVMVNYHDAVLGMWQSFDKSVCRVEFCVGNDVSAREPNEQKQGAVASDIRPEVVARESSVQQRNSRLLASPVESGLVFDNFVVGPSNEVAFEACQRVAGSMCADRTMNPLFLYGGVGLGKTHLMHAMAKHITSTMPWKQISYLTAENFMRQFINSLRDKSSKRLQDELRSLDVLMIDDFQFIGGKEYTQDEFFHTFNDLVDCGKQLIISADRVPGDLAGIKDRIKSRLCGGLVIDIGPTTFELRMGILHKKLEGGQLVIADDVLEYLANNVVSSVRELEGALNKLLLVAKIRNAPLTLGFAAEALSDMQMRRKVVVTAEKIHKLASEFYGVKIPELVSPKKDAKTVRARQVAMYLLKQLSDMSLAEIGRSFGGRNHTTVMYAIKKIEGYKQNDNGFAEQVADLIRRARI